MNDWIIKSPIPVECDVLNESLNFHQETFIVLAEIIEIMPKRWEVIQKKRNHFFFKNFRYTSKKWLGAHISKGY